MQSTLVQLYVKHTDCRMALQQKQTRRGCWNHSCHWLKDNIRSSTNIQSLLWIIRYIPFSINHTVSLSEWYLTERLTHWWSRVSGRWSLAVPPPPPTLVEILSFWVDGHLTSEYKSLARNSFVICGSFLKGPRKRTYTPGRTGVFKTEVWSKDVFQRDWGSKEVDVKWRILIDRNPWRQTRNQKIKKGKKLREKFEYSDILSFSYSLGPFRIQ